MTNNKVTTKIVRYILKECGYSTNTIYRVHAIKEDDKLVTTIRLTGLLLPSYILNVLDFFDIGFVYIKNENYKLIPKKEYSEANVYKIINKAKWN